MKSTITLATAPPHRTDCCRSIRRRGAPRASVRNDRANVMRPLRFPAPPSSLPGLDRVPAAFAGLSGGVGEVVFPCTLVALGEVGIGKPLAFARDIALLWCVSGGHLQSFPGPAPRSSRRIELRTTTTAL